MEKYYTPLQALRKKCLDCGCNQYKEVELCPVQDCPLWPYRFGRIPTPKPETTVLQAMRAKCLDCSETSNDVRECWHEDCYLYIFRIGKNPKRSGMGNAESLRKWREQQEDNEPDKA